MVKKGKTYIIGAGMSGLATACRLQELGAEVVIFESSQQVGGAAASFAWHDFSNLDLGPHIYHTPDKKVEEEWKRKFGDLLHEGKFWSKNVKGKNFDEFYDYPLSRETIGLFPKDIQEKIKKELSELDEVKRSKAQNYLEYVRELVGPTLLELFFTQYPKKLWGIGIEEMTANWAPKRINLTDKTMQFHANQWSAVGKFGSGAILQRMADSFVQAGGKIFLGKEVTNIEYQDHLITSLQLNGQETIEIKREDTVVSTMPINTLGKFLGIPNTLRFRGAKLVFVALNKPAALPGENSFLYYDAPEIMFHRVSEQKKFCATGFPADKTVITAEVAFTKGDERDTCPEEEISKQVVADIIKVSLAKPEEVFDVKVVSLPYVYPFLAKEFELEFVRVLGQLQSFKQLYLIGTGGEFHYADLQILYSKGQDLAERLAADTMETSELVKKKENKNFNQTIKLGRHLVGKGQPPFVIAEIGLNHNGNVAVALELIDKAVEAGCSAVKFQTYTAKNRISKKIKANKYSEELIDTEESLFTMFKRLELSFEDHVKIFEYARAKNIEVFSTPFDLDSFHLLEKLNCPFYKVSSMDLVNLPLIRAIASTGKPLIISTGMSTLGQIEEAVSVVKECGNQNLILLHCISSYPADPADMNLNAIQTLEKVFRVPVGFSDHSIGIVTATVAFTLGIPVIERHFTLNRYMEGPDHVLSSEPAEMAELVRIGNLVPAMLGTGEKTISGSELEALNKFKKCLYAATDIKKGETISLDKISIKGPGGGILPRDIRQVVGRVAKNNIDEDYPIVWDDLC